MRTERLGSLTRLAFGNRASQVYLALVAAVAVYVTIDTAFVQHEDASFAGIWLLLLTGPTVFVFFIVGEMFGDPVSGSAWFLYTAMFLSVLVQSLALGLFVRLLRGRPQPAHPHAA